MTTGHANPEDFDLYALGALDGEEKLAFEQHVTSCAQCRQELAAGRRRMALLALEASPVTPAASVKAALMRRVHAEASAKGGQMNEKSPTKKRWGLRFSLGFAAATAVLALATFWLWKQREQNLQQIDQLQAQLTGTQAQASRDAATMRAMSDVVAAPDTVPITMQQQAGGPPGQAHVLYNARLGVAVYSGEIAPAPADKSYQLWLVPASGAPVNAGLVAANQQNGAIVVHLEPGLAAQAFAVTLEPSGGRPQPTGPKVLVGAAHS
jgi:anti-sigma-K factor RskA